MSPAERKEAEDLCVYLVGHPQKVDIVRTLIEDNDRLADALIKAALHMWEEVL